MIKSPGRNVVYYNTCIIDLCLTIDRRVLGNISITACAGVDFEFVSAMDGD